MTYEEYAETQQKARFRLAYQVGYATGGLKWILTCVECGDLAGVRMAVEKTLARIAELDAEAA